MMIANETGAPSARAFLLLRYTLIVATTYLLLVEAGFSLPSVGGILLIVAALASNVAIAQFPASLIGRPLFGAGIIVADTLWITGVLLQSGRFSAEFFYLYFFVLLLAAIGENVGLIVAAAVVTCVAYVYVLKVSGNHWSLWSSPSLIRLPFLFTVSAFYGFLVDRTRQERRRADAASDELLLEAQISAALVRVGREMISSLDTPVILERLCQVTTEVLHCDCSHTYLWQPEEQVYVPLSEYGDTPEQWQATQVLKIPRLAIADLLARLEQQDVVELAVPAPTNLAAALALEPGSIASLYMPLRRGTEIIGVHIAGHKRRGISFTRSQVRIAQGIAQIASMTLANAKLVEQLCQASRIKSEFVATMSHELRTPLSIILGYNEMLLDGAFGAPTAEQSDIFQRISKNGRELLDMIQATLDLSRLEAKGVELQLHDVQIDAFLRGVDLETRGLQSQSGLAFEWRVAGDLPTVRTDPVKLKMVLKNLVGNAVKFTAQGSVTVGAQKGDGGIELFVTDTGIGIAPEVQAMIFEPFRQGDASFTRRHDGAGLGLYIVRQLLKLLGGTVAVESQVGQGSTFRVWIPRDVVADRPGDASQPKNGTDVSPKRSVSRLGEHERFLLCV